VRGVAAELLITKKRGNLEEPDFWGEAVRQTHRRMKLVRLSKT
jgi:hypothetical protein